MITLQNIPIEFPILQDARTVRVVNSYFENLGVAEVLRADSCYTSLDSYYEVSCTMNDLFFSSWTSAAFYYVVTHPLFILGIVLLIIAIIVVTFFCCYTNNWKKKKEIELLVE